MIKRNLFANYSGAAFAVLTQLLLLPFYIKGLGEHEWGVLSSLFAISAALLILETGVSLAVARGFSIGQFGSQVRLEQFRQIENRYIAFVAIIYLAVMVFGDPIAAIAIHGTNAGAGPLIRITGVMAGMQIIGSLYRSVLMGLGQQVRFNVLFVVFTALRQAAGLAAAWLYGHASSVAFAFAAVFALEAVARRIAALHALHRAGDVIRVGGLPVLSGVSRGALVLAVAGALGAFSTLVDRLYLSATIDPVDLGHYAVAATLSLAALQLVYPLSSALVPILGRFADLDDRARMLRRTYLVLVGLLLPIWAGAAVMASGAIDWWLHSRQLADAIVPLFLPHLVGTTLNALCIPIHLGLLASRLDFRILAANVLACSVQLIVLRTMTGSHGAATGSMAWLVGNAVLLSAYLFFYFGVSEHGERHLA